MPDEVKAKIGSANRGKVRTEEHRQNMSMSQQKRPAISDLTREKLRVANTGRKHNQETKNKISRMKTGITLNLTDEEREARLQSDTIAELISYAIGALLGGWILANWGGSWLYGCMALLCLAILMLYGLSTRIPRPTLARAGI